MVDHHVPCLDSGDCWRRELENCDTRNGMHWKMFYTFTVCVCAIHHTKLYIYILYIYIINVYIMIYIYIHIHVGLQSVVVFVNRAKSPGRSSGTGTFGAESL